jgi:exonuclease III
VEVLKWWKVNIYGFQETKWKVKKTIEIVESYKIIYSARNSTRNGVGVILDEEMKCKV